MLQVVGTVVAVAVVTELAVGKTVTVPAKSFLIISVTHHFSRGLASTLCRVNRQPFIIQIFNFLEIVVHEL